MSKKTLGSLGVLFTILAIGVLVWANRYNIYDWSRLRSYVPSADIEQLVGKSGMNDYGQRLFYVNDPQISDRSTFNSQCKTTEQTIVLGCYTGTNIYVFKVDDQKLAGVEEVTAAHEMLHAAYQRLSKSERIHIDALVQAAYKRVNDPHLQEVVAGYQKTEPGQEANELHSILGTEYANLGPELEAYYGKYFSDRAKVVSLANNYKKVFQEVADQVDKYDADLSLRKSEITRREAAVETKAARLESQKAQMDALLQSGQTEAYNAQVSSYNTGVSSYNYEVSAIRRLIQEYNTLVEKRNALALQQQGLAQSLDSRLDTIKSQ